MTDKVQKIREEVVGIINSINLFTPDEDGKNSSYEAGKLDVASKILQIIDSMQKEPKECMYSKDNYTEEDRKVLCEDCKEKCRFKKKEEPVSEELGEASKEWLRPQLDKSYANYGEVKMMELTHFDGYAMLDAIEFGAKWQKAKDESTTEDLGEYINELSKQFPEVSFAKLSRIAVRVAKWQKQQDQSTIELAEDHAMLSGMNIMEQQMMAKAIDAELYSDGMFVPLIGLKDKEKVSDIKFGDKVKVIIIKED